MPRLLATVLALGLLGCGQAVFQTAVQHPDGGYLVFGTWRGHSATWFCTDMADPANGRRFFCQPMSVEMLDGQASVVLDSKLVIVSED